VTPFDPVSFINVDNLLKADVILLLYKTSGESSMQMCSNCGHENVEGDMFCIKCGVGLGAVSVATKQLDTDEDRLTAGSENLSADHVVLLHFAGYDEPLALQIDQQIILGRTSENSEGIISINLEGYGAVEHGVSRQHAALIRDEHQLFVRDMGSTNHTFLNGEKLAGEREYAVRDGDEISLGRLALKVFFK
jgi:hypothetical protein